MVQSGVKEHELYGDDAKYFLGGKGSMKAFYKEKRLFLERIYNFFKYLHD